MCLKKKLKQYLCNHNYTKKWELIEVDTNYGIKKRVLVLKCPNCNKVLLKKIIGQNII